MIEWGIVTIALITGFKFVTSFLSVIIQFTVLSETQVEMILRLLLVTAIYFVVFWLLLRYSEKIAALISGPDNGKTLSLAIGKRALLHVVLIAVAISIIVSDLAAVVYNIFDMINNNPDGKGLTGLFDSFGFMGTRYTFMIALIAAIFLLVFPRRIAYAVIGKEEPDVLTFDSKPLD